MLLGAKNVKRCFINGLIDEMESSECSFPIVQPNKKVFYLEKSMVNTSNNHGTFQKSIRWAPSQDFHRIARAIVRNNHTIIYITATQNDHRHYSEGLHICSHGHKRCAVREDFLPSKEIHADATLRD